MPSLVSGEAEKRALLAIRETPASEPFAEAVVRGLEAAAPLIAAQALRRLVRTVRIVLRVMKHEVCFLIMRTI